MSIRRLQRRLDIDPTLTRVVPGNLVSACVRVEFCFEPISIRRSRRRLDIDPMSIRAHTLSKLNLLFVMFNCMKYDRH